MTRLDADWLAAPEARAICAALTAEGHQALFVGGCVRNTLLGQPVTDLDIATDATPETVIALAAAAGLKSVPTGLDHGTVTLVAGGHPFEVTTFRRDVETFGRHAVVAFSTDIAEDAGRRDFTMNALYAEPDGTLLDPLGGLPDLRAGHVRFVGDADRRIAEDFLRVLRFFRFFAWYGHPEEGPDPEGLAACARNRDGLEQLSRERVRAELAKLLAAPDPAPALAAMHRTGILERVLPGARPGPISALVALEAATATAPRWQRRLALLGGAPDWPDRLRLSRADRRAVADIAAAIEAGHDAAVAAYTYGAVTARDAALVAAARGDRALPDDLEARIATGAAASFPLRAADLPELSGPELGRTLKRLEAAWIASGFTLDAGSLRALA